ncbi:MAG: hypothetical protein MR763_11815 [Clostridiales bacterium]|nr:hypothetical protein [Clostridiales bacterium]
METAAICGSILKRLPEAGSRGGKHMLNIKEKVEQVVAKLRADDKLLEKFQTNPAAVIEEYVGVDLPDDQVNALVEGIKAKLTVDKLGSALGGLFRK